MLKEKIKHEILIALKKADYILDADFVPSLENTKDVTHGDFATNVAMHLAKVAKKNPREIAQDIIANFDTNTTHVDKLEMAGPGFINFFMNKEALTKTINVINDLAINYGHNESGAGEKYCVEYVSANPTGDLHLGHARGAAIGDSLCRILNVSGYEVVREYYVNDAGNQIRNLVLSVYNRYLEALGHDFNMPEDGYHGADVANFGRELSVKYGDKFVEKLDEHFDFLREVSLEFEIAKIRQDLSDFRVEFDLFVSEQSLYDNGLVAKAIDLLDEKGYIYENDGALWLRSTDFGDDKDRVLKKSDGTYTYLTPDIANHIEKIKRGNNKLVDLWGADHHGYIARVKASLQALGHDENKLEVDIIQMVRAIKDGAEFKMSKRTGKAITLRDLMEEVGVDAVRYFFASRNAETQMDFDLDLATKQSNENPVYYAQYAFARTCSLLREAAKQGFEPVLKSSYSNLTHEKEIEVLKLMGDFPTIVADAARKRKPHMICNYVHDLVGAFHSLYGAKKFIDANDKDGTTERLALIKALNMTIKNALNLIGVSAPESM